MKVQHVQKSQNILIQRLRQQPRHGRAVDPEDLKIKLESTLKRVRDNIPEISILLKQYSDIIDASVNETNNLAAGLNNVTTIQNNFAEKIKHTTGILTKLEETVGTLTKAYGLSIGRADEVSKKFREIAIASGIGETKIYEYAKSLKEVTAGTLTSTKVNTQFQKKLLLGQQYMQNNLEITEEAAQGYEYYATSVAKSGVEALEIQNELAKSIADATGLDQLQVQKQLTEDIGGLTADLQVQYSRIPGSLELAVLKSKALDMSMKNLHTAGETLLNIESSIGSEMEYQLLTGKRLLTQDGKSLTNAYRMATIQGDANKQAELMNKFIKDQGPMLEKNLYARKKAAELLGTDETTLARSIQKNKILNELGMSRIMDLKGQDYMTEVLKLRKDAEARGDKETEAKINELIKNSDLRSTQDRMADNIELIASVTAKNAGIDLAATREAALTSGKSFEAVLEQFNDPNVMKAMGGLTMFGETTKTLTSGYGEIIKIIPLFGEKLKDFVDRMTKLIPTIPTSVTDVKTAKTDKKDALIMNDGVIRFHQDDKFMRVNDSTMIAGTNVNGNRQLARSINSGNSIDYAKMAQAIALAMQNVKVEATVKPDMLFAATKMNNGRRFS